jgi:1,2-phenylacetyl-CoA epoxidase PaaB subunit
MEVVANFVTLASGQVYAIRPPSVECWMIRNVLISGKAGLERATETDSFQVDEQTTKGWVGQVFNVTNEQFIQVRNKAGVDIKVGWDGVKTRTG